MYAAKPRSELEANNFPQADLRGVISSRLEFSHFPSPKNELWTVRGLFTRRMAMKPGRPDKLDLRNSIKAEKTISDVPFSQKRIPSQVGANLQIDCCTWPKVSYIPGFRRSLFCPH